MRSARSLKLTFALTMLIASAAVALPNLSGHWEGAYSRDGAVMQIRVDFRQSGDSLSGRFDIPQWSVWDEPVTEINFNYPDLSFRIINGVFKMVVDDDHNVMAGVNDKWGPPLKLHLTRTRDWLTRFYELEEVTFKNGDITLAGTLVKPTTPPPYPAVVTIHGSGDQGSRAAWRYRSFAYLLAQAGIASLLYDKRGMGESGGDPDSYTFYDLADDAAAAVKTLSARKDIVPGKVGLLGISQGGWVAPLVAGKVEDLPYAILYEGPAVPLYRQEIDVTENTMRNDGFSEAAIDSALEHQRLYFEVVAGESSWDLLELSTRIVSQAEWKDYVQLPTSNADPDLLWWRRMVYDPQDALTAMNCPVLAIFGAEDPLVPPASNEELMRQYLTQAGVEFEIMVVPGIGHSEWTFQTLTGDSWDWPRSHWVWPQRVEALDAKVVEWVKGH